MPQALFFLTLGGSTHQNNRLAIRLNKQPATYRLVPWSAQSSVVSVGVAKINMLETIFGTKLDTTQTWTQNGHRLAITKVKVTPMVVTQIKQQAKEGYQAIQVGFGNKKFSRLTRQLQGHLKKSIKDAGEPKAPRFLREAKADQAETMTLGQTVTAGDVLKIGDMVNVTGKSRGRGFSGVVKRWGFHGGPKTHGQSDRHRAPGSIGQGTTPGRIFKGKKMAGHYGNTQMTVRNLTVVKIDPDHEEVWLTGQVPGSKNSLVTIRKVGENKKNLTLIGTDETAA